MPAILGALQFDNDKVGALVDAQQIDTPPTVLPVAELLSDNQCVWRDDFRPGFQQGLEMLPLLYALLRKRRGRYRSDLIVIN